jgi:hypothetical protein
MQTSEALKGKDCLCMYQTGQFAGEIPLVGRLLYSVVIAAVRQGISADQFMADAIKEKLVREPGTSTRNPIPSLSAQAPREARLELQSVVNKAVAVLRLVAGEATKEIGCAPESVVETFLAGIMDLSYDTAEQLNAACEAACKEWRDASHGHDQHAPRMAA